MIFHPYRWWFEVLYTPPLGGAELLSAPAPWGVDPSTPTRGGWVPSFPPPPVGGGALDPQGWGVWAIPPTPTPSVDDPRDHHRWWSRGPALRGAAGDPRPRGPTGRAARAGLLGARRGGPGGRSSTRPPGSARPEGGVPWELPWGELPREVPSVYPSAPVPTAGRRGAVGASSWGARLGGGHGRGWGVGTPPPGSSPTGGRGPRSHRSTPHGRAPHGGGEALWGAARRSRAGTPSPQGGGRARPLGGPPGGASAPSPSAPRSALTAPSVGGPPPSTPRPPWVDSVSPCGAWGYGRRPPRPPETPIPPSAGEHGVSAILLGETLFRVDGGGRVTEVPCGQGVTPSTHPFLGWTGGGRGWTGIPSGVP